MNTKTTIKYIGESIQIYAQIVNDRSITYLDYELRDIERIEKIYI